MMKHIQIFFFSFFKQIAKLQNCFIKEDWLSYVSILGKYIICWSIVNNMVQVMILNARPIWYKGSIDYGVYQCRASISSIN
jgi:hypothetical protein